MNVREFTRMARVKEIEELIANSKSRGESLDKKTAILAIMNKYNVSQRTASEYFAGAKFKNEITG